MTRWEAQDEISANLKVVKRLLADCEKIASENDIDLNYRLEDLIEESKGVDDESWSSSSAYC